MNTGDFKKRKKRIKSMLNLIVCLLGIILIAIGLIFGINNCSEYFGTMFTSVGTSILATGIVSAITSHYLMKKDAIKDIINIWGLVNIYQRKSYMNFTSNEYLKKCKHSIDIMAIGMSGFLNSQGDLLKSLINKGITIRIISCKSEQYLNQREKDESIHDNFEATGRFYKEVKALDNWVNKNKNSNSKIRIKYHETYPAFSYLRIDDHIFFGPNLYLMQSQLCFSYEFSDYGQGASELKEYFDKLWNSSMLSDSL